MSEPLGRIEVLDHGFIELLDVMGDEQEVARAARISYGNTADRSWEEDARLIRYLHANGHTSPFEMVDFKWRVKLPIYIARQWIRHRTANVNEFSMRYADPAVLSAGESIDYYTPSEWRIKDPSNKQGSIPAPPDHNLHRSLHGDVYFDLYREAHEKAIWAYKALQEAGVANELARGVLPLSTYTEWVWKNDLHNTLHLLRLRVDPHAQWEFQQYTNAMVSLMRAHMPRLMDIVWPEAAS